MNMAEEQLRSLGVVDIDTSGAKLYSYAIRLGEGERLVVAYTSTHRAVNAAVGCCNKRRIFGTKEAFDVKRWSSDNCDFITVTKTRNLDLVKLELAAKVAPSYTMLTPEESLQNVIRARIADGQTSEEILEEMKDARVDLLFIQNIESEMKSVSSAIFTRQKHTATERIKFERALTQTEIDMCREAVREGNIFYDSVTNKGIYSPLNPKAKQEKQWFLENAPELCPDEWKDEM